MNKSLIHKSKQRHQTSEKKNIITIRLVSKLVLHAKFNIQLLRYHFFVFSFCEEKKSSIFNSKVFCTIQHKILYTNIDII